MNHYAKSILLLCAIALLNHNVLICADESSVQSTHSFEGVVSKKVAYKYLQFLPASYDHDSSKEWPLILFLHGAGERGDDLQKVKVHGPPKMVKSRPDFPFVVVSPQCPKDTVWDSEGLLAMLDEVTHRLRIDEKRVYLTGLSMGGFGTWDIVQRMPNIFAAAMPVCGGGDAELASVIKTVPIWVFHGGSDNVVKTKRSQDMVTALKKVGSKVKYTEYEGLGHNSWDRTYRDENALRWLFHQKKSKKTDELGEK